MYICEINMVAQGNRTFDDNIVCSAVFNSDVCDKSYSASLFCVLQ